MLKYREDWRSIAFVCTALALQMSAYFLFAELPWWALVPWVAAAAWMSWLTAVITHNTVHVPMFKSRGLNNAMQYLLTITYGHPVSAFVPGHNLSHHCHTQTRRDVMRTTKLRFRWNLLNLLLAPPVLARDIMASDYAYAKAMRTERPRWFRQWVSEYVVFWAFTIALLVYSPLAFVICVMIPRTAASGGIVGINFLQHDGADHKSTWNHSRNFVGPWINWWAFNNGYHTIHHMEPGLHWTKCKEAHEVRVKPHIHPNLDQPNLALYIWRGFIWPGRRMDYLGNPYVLPEEGPDVPWIPGRGDTPAEVSLGAEA